MRHFVHILLLFLLPAVGSLISCSDNRPTEAFAIAESLMEEHPDSALAVLRSIEEAELSSRSDKARNALLMSMALDKNYIDTTSFEVLAPAIDYYLENGTPDERLRTLYYQGRIYQNRRDMTNAFNSFIKGVDLSSCCTDSLTLARTLVAQGGLYYDYYDYDSYTSCHVRAADIYMRLSRKWNEFDCLLNALNGAVASGNKATADSILSLCDDFHSLDAGEQLALKKHQLSYALRFDDTLAAGKLSEYLEKIQNTDCLISR